MAQTFRVLSYVFFALSAIAFILAIVFYRKFDIKGLVKDRRAHAKALKHQFTSSQKSSAAPIFDEMNREAVSVQEIKREANKLNEAPTLNTNETTILTDNFEATTVLSDETVVLDNATTILNEQTTILTQKGEHDLRVSSTDEVIE